ncbi:MAG: pentapeptide repeat-containing protein [Bacteroidota bacterium]
MSQDSEKLKDKINFHPCGIIKRQLDNEKQLDDSNRLLKIIGLSYCLGLDGFAKSIGSFMSGANLSRANFSGANLSGINLSGANLSRAKLRQTDLTETNFSSTNLSDCDLCRCDLTGANLQGAILENAYLRGADCRNAKFEEATLNGADLCRAYLHNADFRNAKLLNTSFRKTNLDAANFESTNFSFLLWDVHTNWFLAKGLHKVDATPNELLKNSDYAQAIKLSKAYEMLDRGNISEAISICNKVAENIKIPSLQAHIYNRFAWLCSLQNKNNKCREEIINLADKACNINSSSGNYKDTYAITIMLQPNFDMPGILGDAGDNELSNETIDRPNPYASAIELLEEALECEDFKKLALPNMEKIKQRRKDWIKSLNLRINPLTADVIQLLLKEEY